MIKWNLSWRKLGTQTALALALVFSVHAQQNPTIDQIITLDEVNSDFQQALQKVEVQSDTIHVYFDYIKRLIDRGNYLSADSVITEYEVSFKALNDSTFMARLYKERAFMYKVQRRLPQALQDYLWLKAFYEQKNDSNELVEIYSLMAEYYRAIREFELMDKHLKMAENLFRIAPIDTDHLAYWNSRKASYYTEYRNDADSILIFAERALELAEESGDFYTQALALNELGLRAVNINQDPSLYKVYLEQSMAILLEHERYRDYIDVANNLINATNHLDPVASLALMRKILALEEENEWFKPMIFSLQIIKAIYISLGIDEEIDKIEHKIYEAQIQDIESNNALAVSDLSLTYTNELTLKELEVQEQRTKLAESEARNNLRAFSIAAIIAFFLAIIAIIAIIVNRRFRRKNELLNLRKQAIETANAKLQKSLKQQKVLYKELNHRVKNNLTVLTGLIYLQEMDENDEALRDSMKKLRNRIKSMALAHESLYNTESDGKIKFGAYLEALFDDLKNALTKEQIVKTAIDCTNFELEMKHAIPLAMIMNELFTNSVKHGFKAYKEGLISIKGEVKESQIIIHYKDNGSGYNPNQKQSLGLHLVGLLLEQIDASIIEDKSSEKGFYIILSLPQFVKE